MASWLWCQDGRAAHHFAERAKSVEAANRTRIITFALSHRLPAIFNVREYVEAEALMPDQFRRADDYVDKILRGTYPGNIPVEQPTKFNLTAAVHSVANGTKRTCRSRRSMSAFGGCQKPTLAGLRIPPPMVHRFEVQPTLRHIDSHGASP
jgi:hypothetical protein